MSLLAGQRWGGNYKQNGPTNWTVNIEYGIYFGVMDRLQIWYGHRLNLNVPFSLTKTNANSASYFMYVIMSTATLRLKVSFNNSKRPPWFSVQISRTINTRKKHGTSSISHEGTRITKPTSISRTQLPTSWESKRSYEHKIIEASRRSPRSFGTMSNPKPTQHSKSLTWKLYKVLPRLTQAKRRASVLTQYPQGFHNRKLTIHTASIGHRSQTGLTWNHSRWSPQVIGPTWSTQKLKTGQYSALSILTETKDIIAPPLSQLFNNSVSEGKVWIKSFISNREQCVLVGDGKSDWVKAQSGVPQGSMMGLLLFALSQHSQQHTMHYFALCWWCKGILPNQLRWKPCGITGRPWPHARHYGHQNGKSSSTAQNAVPLTLVQQSPRLLSGWSTIK